MSSFFRFSRLQSCIANENQKGRLANAKGAAKDVSIDYLEIGRLITRRRKTLGLRKVQVCERAEINDKYLSCIERATSIPSLEVIIKIAAALETTPDEFLTGCLRNHSDQWRDVAELLRGMDSKHLSLAKSFLMWLSEQKL